MLKYIGKICMFSDSEPPIEIQKSICLIRLQHNIPFKWRVRTSLNLIVLMSTPPLYQEEGSSITYIVLCMKVPFSQLGVFLTTYTSEIYYHGSQP